ncbi:hypothetical protein CPB83DRAFT_846160 [Crepidotus variabilis]|uniref:Uncharacterized protein n=1 Tax=Crepidotus variabilis TaxID=179855 RepID=A0A9P6JTL2_9AGAR|nr:hypothetical protein CPB83DRAFT_846160 [Crepidotus variabilis]
MGKKNKNKPLRLLCLMHAASDAVKILEANGWRCCVVGGLAAKLHGASDIPNAATLVVLPTDGRPPPLTARQILIDSLGQHFRPQINTNPDIFVYHDPRTTSSDIQARRQCEVQIITMNRLLAGFRQEEIQLVNDLPVIHRWPLLVYELEAIIKKYGQGWMDRGHDVYSHALGCLSSGFRELAAAWSSREDTFFSGDEEFTALARSILSGLSQVRQKAFQPFVDLYQKQLEKQGEKNKQAETVKQGDNLKLGESVNQGESVKSGENIRRQENVGGQWLPLSAILDGKDVLAPSPAETIPNSGSVPNDSKRNRKPHQDVGNINSKKHAGTTTQAEAIFSVAVKVVQMLRGLEFHCAILGPVLAYEGSAISNKINIAIFRPTDITPSDVRRTLMTSLWYHHFRLQGTGETETLYFQLKTIKMKVDLIPRNMVAINICTPASLGLPTLEENHIVDLPVIPATVLSTLGFKDAGSQAFEEAASSETEQESSQMISFNADDAKRLRALFETWNSLGGHKERHGLNVV